MIVQANTSLAANIITNNSQTAIASWRSFQIRVWTGAMVEYVYNLGTKKRNKCLLDNKVQTNSR